MNLINERDLARFGHTLNRINDNEFLIFGGAVENAPNAYVTTNDTFILNKNTLEWT